MSRPRAVPRTTRLADGRAIHYFDDRPGNAEEPAADGRDLEPSASTAEMRHDALLDEWVVLASHRQARTHLPAASDCPLCASTDSVSTEIPARDYDVVVFENRFPSLPAAPPDGEPHGRCEVIVYDSDHHASFGALGEARLRTIADALVARSEALAAAPGVAHVLCFENRGEEIGVTLHHPHGQIYAYPFIPPRIGRLASVAGDHHSRTGACLGCDVLAAELADPRRIVATGSHGVAYVPRAARWPYEIHVLPRRHVASLGDLSTDELDELVEIQADALHRLDGLFKRAVPYMAGWLAVPAGADPEAWHLRLEIVSPQRDVAKLKYLAGSETLAGAFINDVRPEDAAQRLRAAPGRAAR